MHFSSKIKSLEQSYRAVGLGLSDSGSFMTGSRKCREYISMREKAAESILKEKAAEGCLGSENKIEQ